MSKDFLKKGYATKKTFPVKRRQWKPWLVLASLSVLFALSGFFIFQYKIQLGAYVSKGEKWLAERKSHWRSAPIKNKVVAVNKTDIEPRLHFEFYTTLPSMRMNTTELATKQDLTVHKTLVASADELEQELSVQIKQQVNRTSKKLTNRNTK